MDRSKGSAYPRRLPPCSWPRRRRPAQVRVPATSHGNAAESSPSGCKSQGRSTCLWHLTIGKERIRRTFQSRQTLLYRAGCPVAGKKRKRSLAPRAAEELALDVTAAEFSSSQQIAAPRPAPAAPHAGPHLPETAWLSAHWELAVPRPCCCDQAALRPTVRASVRPVLCPWLLICSNATA